MILVRRRVRYPAILFNNELYGTQREIDIVGTYGVFLDVKIVTDLLSMVTN